MAEALAYTAGEGTPRPQPASHETAPDRMPNPTTLQPMETVMTFRLMDRSKAAG